MWGCIFPLFAQTYMFVSIFANKRVKLRNSPREESGINFDDFHDQLCTGSGRDLALELSFFGCSHICVVIRVEVNADVNVAISGDNLGFE